jgi:hypothetical protein
MKRFEMKIEVSRFKDGKLKVIVRHEENSYFWKSDLTECPRFQNIKRILEVLMMVDWWNKERHNEFELLWDSLFVKTTKKGILERT